MDEYRALLVLAGCLLVALPLEWVLRTRVRRSPRRWLASLVPGAVLFACWGAVAQARGQWRFDGRHLTGLTLREHLPVEELLVLVVVPTCALLVHEAVGTVVARRRQDSGGTP